MLGKGNMSANAALDAVMVDGSPISHVLEPESVAEAASLLADANRSGQRLLLCGGRTRLAFGNTGGPFGAALSTRKLNRVIHYEPDDMTLAVEPGCTIEQIKSLLETHNQTLGLDAAHENDATIGASVATGLSGPRRFGSGSLKDWLIGIEVAGPDGAISKAGGMVVKNVTGFDMMHMHYGALGAFGLIVRMNLKVFPRPASSRAISLRFDELDSAYQAAITLLTSQLQASSIVVSNGGGWTLDVRCDAPASAIDRLTERVTTAACSAVSPASVDVSDNGDRAVDSFRTVVDLSGSEAVARLPIPASRQHHALATLQSWVSPRVCADFGSGVVYLAGHATGEWVERVRSISNDASFLSLPADLKRGIDVFGLTPGPAAEVIRRMKRAFDPHGTLNRGRFVLGL
jgi:glycolate oxidase FAD binding subunit